MDNVFTKPKVYSKNTSTQKEVEQKIEYLICNFTNFFWKKKNKIQKQNPYHFLIKALKGLKLCDPCFFSDDSYSCFFA